MTIRRTSAIAVAAALAALAGAPAANAEVVSSFDQPTGSLRVLGDEAANQIVIGRDQLGVITVDGQVPLDDGLPGSFPTVFNTRTISVLGAGGDDVLRMDQTNGPLPGAQMFGGTGTTPSAVARALTSCSASPGTTP